MKRSAPKIRERQDGRGIIPPHIREFLDGLALIIAEDLRRRSRERTNDPRTAR
jgi:hypothetical protein